MTAVVMYYIELLITLTKKKKASSALDIVFVMVLISCIKLKIACDATWMPVTLLMLGWIDE